MHQMLLTDWFPIIYYSLAECKLPPFDAALNMMFFVSLWTKRLIFFLVWIRIVGQLGQMSPKEVMEVYGWFNLFFGALGTVSIVLMSAMGDVTGVRMFSDMFLTGFVGITSIFWSPVFRAYRAIIMFAFELEEDWIPGQPTAWVAAYPRMCMTEYSLLNGAPDFLRAEKGFPSVWEEATAAGFFFPVQYYHYDEYTCTWLILSKQNKKAFIAAQYEQHGLTVAEYKAEIAAQLPDTLVGPAGDALLRIAEVFAAFA